MIPEDWEVREVWEIGEVKTGKTPPTKNKNFFKGEYPFIKIPDMTEGFYIQSTDETLSEDGKNHMKSLMLPKNSVCVSCLATIGNVGITTKNSFTNQQINSIIPNEKVDNVFVYYYFKNKKEYLKNMSGGGSVYNNLSKSKFQKLKIILPPLSEQKSIAKILSDLDEKIEVNRQMNEILEELGQTLFKRWFVDFEFPNEKGKPYRSSGGRMVESELGEIPEGWEVKSLIEIVRQLKPGTNHQPDRIDHGIPFINIKNILDGFIDLNGVKFISEEDCRFIHKSWKPEENDILISRIGTLGNVAVIKKEDLPIAVHYNNIVIKSKKFSPQLMYFLLKSFFFQEQYHLKKKVTVQEYVTIDEVEKIKIIFPSKFSLNKLEDSFEVLFDKIRLNSIEIQILRIIKNSLLPKLMSGKIRVRV